MPIRILLLLIICSISCNRPQVNNSNVGKANNIESRAVILIGSKAKFVVEIADTPKERQEGLMNRAFLAQDKGMLFIFDESADHSFWMKNTLIALDLVYFDQNLEVIGVLENLEPFSHEARSINKPSKYVLEINAGTVKKRGIIIGDKATLSFTRNQK